ncbi:MAG: WG repeat-containing protein [Desulfobacterota bacterium]|nr:WG repeat-containing protein [Thermodesulfobacteriota bacterium]
MYMCRHITISLVFSFIIAPSLFAYSTLIPYEDSETLLWGYKDTLGRIVIPPKYHIAGPFSLEGIATVSDHSGWQYIDKTGKPLVRFMLSNRRSALFSDSAFLIKHGLMLSERDKNLSLPYSRIHLLFDAYSHNVYMIPRHNIDDSDINHKNSDAQPSANFSNRSIFTIHGTLMLSPHYEKMETYRKDAPRSLFDDRWFLLIRKGW